MFNGDDPAGWIARAEVYFNVQNTRPEIKVNLAQLCMDGPTIHFFKGLLEENETLTWENLKDALLERYGGVSDGNVFEQLSALQQEGTIEEYIEDFERLVAQLPKLPNDQYLGYFVHGLKDKIRGKVRSMIAMGPMSRAKLMNVARAVERELEEGRRDWTSRRSHGSMSRHVFGNKVVTQNEGRHGDWGMARNNKDNRDLPGGNVGGKSIGGPRGMFSVGRNKTHTTNTGNWRDRNVRNMSSQEIADRRQKGLCFKCGGPYHPRHQCPDKNLRVMVLENDSEDENEVRVLNDEDVETGAEELQLNVLTFEHVLTFDKQTEYYQDMLQCIRLQGTVGTIPVLMLVDSGANKNFMSRHLALALGLRITETPARDIRLGDEHVAPTLGECHGVIIFVQGVKWEIDVVLFDLGGYDLVLGMAWLTQIGCTYIDWTEKKMCFDYQGEWIEIRGIRTRGCTPLQNYVDENHFDQLHCDVQQGMVTPNQQSEMKSVLDNFDNIFKEPQGLPPGRQQEHAIHLLNECVFKSGYSCQEEG
ncbi:unnamed protein product [Trifolium pratense]|uniref:Uncharacterized protein n=1 Tax=Trifolium pratense TaxID=57577 RepID=A0ACB0KA66_TRIPR|nr:unnamed protein product [Trifolium pratense]